MFDLNNDGVIKKEEIEVGTLNALVLDGRVTGQSQILCLKNIYPRPKFVMKQVYMKATELKINVVSFIV